MKLKRVLAEISFVVLYAMVCISHSAYAEETYELPAPFGMKWGQSEQEVQSNDISLWRCRTGPDMGWGAGVSTEQMTRCFAGRLQRNLGDVDNYELYFHNQHGLVKIAYISNEIEEDTLDTRAKDRYQELKNMLIRKYGNPYEEAETIPKHESSYSCLTRASCGTWHSIWRIGKPSEFFNIFLSVKPKGKWMNYTGYITLVYTSWMLETEYAEQKKRQITNQKDIL